MKAFRLCWRVFSVLVLVFVLASGFIHLFDPLTIAMIAVVVCGYVALFVASQIWPHGPRGVTRRASAPRP